MKRKLQKEEKKERGEMTWHSYEGPGNINDGGEMGLCLGRCQKEGGGSLSYREGSGTIKEGKEEWKGQWSKLAGGRKRATMTEDIGGIK